MNYEPQEQWTKRDLMEVGKYQKNIMWMILISLMTIFIPFASIVTGIIQIYYIYKLAVAVRSKIAWVYMILAFIPLVGLIGLLHINSQATRTLQSNGIKVGLMGASKEDFEKVQESAQQGAPVNANKRISWIILLVVSLLVMAQLVVITLIIVISVNFKNSILHTEATQSMEQLGREITAYRENYGSLPPESYIEKIRDNIHGYNRLDNLHYRARWIGPKATSDEILAYYKKDYRSLLSNRNGYIMLRLDGSVQWMEEKEFEKILAQQQSQIEIEMSRRL